jgi:hypothetical protein
MKKCKLAGDAAATDIEEMAMMQREKPSIQAIPNWRGRSKK